MDTKLIALLCFGVLSLFLCLLSAFFNKTEKVKLFILIKGFSSISYIVLALVLANLTYSYFAYAMFLTIGLCFFMFSNIIRAIPTKTDMFHAFYTVIESLGFVFLTISVVYSLFDYMIALIAGGVAFVALIISYLIIKKSDLKIDKLTNIFLFLGSSAYLGTAIGNVIGGITIQTILFGVSATFCMVYTIFQNFTNFQNTKCNIIKNLFLGLALICVAMTIYFI